MSKANSNNTTLPVYDPFAMQTAIADSLVRQQKIGGFTHFIFAETRPSIDGGNERVVVQRLAIPTDLVPLIARAMLAGDGETCSPNEVEAGKAVLQ
jgi:hypothetical protein